MDSAVARWIQLLKKWLDVKNSSSIDAPKEVLRAFEAINALSEEWALTELVFAFKNSQL